MTIVIMLFTWVCYQTVLIRQTGIKECSLNTRLSLNEGGILMKVIRKATIADVKKVFKKMIETTFTTTGKCQICKVSDG